MGNQVIIFTSCFLLLFVINFSNGLALKDLCTTLEKQNGKCIAIGECPSLLKLLKKRPIPLEYRERLQKAQCGFVGLHPKVCCPQDDLEVTTSSNTPRTDITVTDTLIPEIPLSNLLPNLQTCGHFVEDRIFLGEQTQLDGYPWTVLLEYETPNGNRFHCGGVLINHRYVLTAAHCISGKGIEDNWKLVRVRLGEHDRESDRDCDNYSFAQTDNLCTADVVNVEIEEKILHEQYDPNNTAQYYDIALLRLAEKIIFSDFIRPICLQPAKDLAMVSRLGESATISGWGVTKTGSNSNKKQWGRLQIKNNTECEAAYAKKNLQLREDQICAFTINDWTSCSQDSGGALVNVNRPGSSTINYFAVGVMSLSHPICALKEYPVVYTKVQSYVPWIISKLKP